MTIVVVADFHGWGKGHTLAEAFEHYAEHNGSMAWGQKYECYEIIANSFDDVWGDTENFSIHGKNGAKIISKELRTF